MLCNAEVVSGSCNEKAREGCMSVPDFTGLLLLDRAAGVHAV